MNLKQNKKSKRPKKFHDYNFSFGKLSLMNTVSTPLVPTRAPPTSSWNVSMFIITKPPVANMSLAPFWSIWSQEPWILSDQVPLAKSSVLITLSLDSLELVTTGLKAITQKVPNLLILFLMLSAKNQNPAIVSKDFSWPTHWEVSYLTIFFEKALNFWPRFYIVVLGIAFFPLIYFLIGFLFPLSIWTFMIYPLHRLKPNA